VQGGLKLNKQGKTAMTYERLFLHDNIIVLTSYPVFRSLFTLNSHDSW
jgi:hypothetical protein